MPDSSAIDNALVAKLLNDATLRGLMPDGVFFDEANPGAKRFVIVSIVEAHDGAVFGGRAYEDVLYLVKSVALSTAFGDTKAAAARIDALLDDQDLTIGDGYQLIMMYRDSPVRYTEVDDVDRSLRWQHRGGRYQVMASVAVAGAFAGIIDGGAPDSVFAGELDGGGA